MTPFEELFSIADKLRRTVDAVSEENVIEPMNALLAAANEVGRSFSGSWHGYHSRVYYAELKPPPPGAHFSQEWGLSGEFGLGSTGHWREFDAEYVKSYILDQAGNPNLAKSRDASNEASAAFEMRKADILSIVQGELDEREDSFLASLKNELEELKPLTPHEAAERMRPTGKIITHETLIIGQGMQVPPHMRYITELRSIQHNFAICRAAADIATKAASHLERKTMRNRAIARIGTNIFIGHGRSSVWRDLKDFIKDRLHLPWDEFNRVPIAGVTNIARLAEMLDAAAFAFIVMTAEDEMADGALQARMNVVHEAGLFQGRLGFTKAIVLLEDGCKEFSNIQGLGQIRFPKGNISAVFEEIRQVLEREGVLIDQPK